MGRRYSINISLRVAFISFFLLASNASYIYAESLEDEGIKEVVVNALLGFANNNADEFMADFSKTSFKGKASGGPNKIKIVSYDEFKNYFIAALARRTILSADNITFLDIKVSGNNANVSVEYSLSLYPVETSEIVREQRSDAVTLKKDDDSWKIIRWNVP